MQLTSRSSATAPCGLQGPEVGQAQAQRRERAGVQEVAAGQAVAEMDRLVRIDAEHGEWPRCGEGRRGGSRRRSDAPILQPGLATGSTGRGRRRRGRRASVAGTSGPLGIAVTWGAAARTRANPPNPDDHERRQRPRRGIVANSLAWLRAPEWGLVAGILVVLALMYVLEPRPQLLLERTACGSCSTRWPCSACCRSGRRW